MITVTLTFQSAAEAAVFLAGRSDPTMMTRQVDPPKTAGGDLDHGGKSGYAAYIETLRVLPPIDHGRSMSAVETAESFTEKVSTEPQPSTPSTPSESTADSNKAVAQLGATPDYKEIVRCVNALAKKGGNALALKILGQFKTVSGDQVNHGNKLQLTDYQAFIGAAEGALS